MVMWKLTGRIRRFAARSTPSVIAPGRSKSPLLLSAKFSAQSELNDFFRLLLSLPLQTKTDTTLFLRRHLNQSRGMYCVIKCMTPLYLVICFVTSYPRMTGLVNG